MVVQICIGSACHIKGSYRVIQQLQELVEEHDLQGEVELMSAFCLGKCSSGVSVKLDDQPVDKVMPDQVEAFFQSKFGESIPVSYTCSIVEGKETESENRIYAAQNSTERRRAEQRIRYLARIDALTKIPNRMQFQHLLQRAIARARRAGKPLCLFYVDVDHFKEINDTFGHLAGDATLETVAERLSAAMPEGSIIGRLAGDEFAVIVDKLEPGPNMVPALDKLAREILDHLAEPFFVQGNEVFMTGSMGIALYPSDARNVIDLIRNADAALVNIQDLLGHTRIKTTQRYCRVSNLKVQRDYHQAMAVVLQRTG